MVLLGIDRIKEYDVRKLLSGKRLAVISSASGLGSSMRFPVDILNEEFDVRCILSPEHGPRGVAGPGEKISGGIDRFTGLPVYSLFEDFYSSADKTVTERAY